MVNRGCVLLVQALRTTGISPFASALRLGTQERRGEGRGQVPLLPSRKGKRGAKVPF